MGSPSHQGEVFPLPPRKNVESMMHPPPLSPRFPSSSLLSNRLVARLSTPRNRRTILDIFPGGYYFLRLRDYAAIYYTFCGGTGHLRDTGHKHGRLSARQSSTRVEPSITMFPVESNGYTLRVSPIFAAISHG